MTRRYPRRWLVATLVLTAALSGSALVGAAAGAPDGQATDTTTDAPMGTSPDFPTETVAVGLALAGVVLAAAGAVALRRRDERAGAGEERPEDRRD